MKATTRITYQALKEIFFTLLSRCPMRCKSGRLHVRHKIKLIIILIQFPEMHGAGRVKNQVNRRNIFNGKNALFLESIITILKRYQ